MSDMRIVGVEADRLARIRERDADEFGNPLTARTAQGWEPLRCCLNRASEGERIALICYTPWSQPSPWLEAGPVFVHYGPCAGYPTPEVYPTNFSSGKRMMHPFGHDGERVYEHITYVGEDGDHETVVRDILARPEVAFLHVRSATAGCFTFEVRPAG
jgi:hypothetical protein